jgi:carbon-monoxide dehydrogenase iron sulfur subunit
VKRIVADPAKCMACRACEIACALAHVPTDDLVEAITRHRARPSIYIETAEGLAVPLQCRHCEDAPCVAVCPSGALSRAGEAEPVVVDQEKCIGCAYCVQVCPFGVVRLAIRSVDGGPGRRQAVVKCDLCARRRSKGLEPACVSACPVGALVFEEVDQSARRARTKAAAGAVAVAIGEKRKG